MNLEVTQPLLLRVSGAIEIILLSCGEHTLLEALNGGNTIGIAVEVALAAEFDPQPMLTREFARGHRCGMPQRLPDWNETILNGIRQHNPNRSSSSISASHGDE